MEKTSLLCLPEEIILYIASFLTTTDIFQGLASTCVYLNTLLRDAARYGSLANFVFLSSNIYIDLDSKEQHSLTQHVTKYCHPFKGMEFKGFDNGKLLSEIVAHSCRYNRITSFCFERYANQNWIIYSYIVLNQSRWIHIDLV